MSDEQLAREIANELFTNGNGEIADRLVCEVNGRDRGGWCRQAVEKIVAARIKPLVEALEQSHELVVDAIMHGMPITAKVAKARNDAVQLLRKRDTL